MRILSRWCVRALLTTVSGLAALPCLAGGLSVMPTRIDLAAGRGVQSVILTNTSDQTVTVESEVRAWPDSDAPGLSASEVVVSPAVVTLPPHQRMRVRVGLLRPHAGDAERAWRLYFTELPAPAMASPLGIGVRLRIGIPVFAAPARPDSRALQWSLRDGENGWVIEARNDGNVHARVARAVLVEGAAALALPQPALYVLAGSTMQMPLGRAVGPGARVRWLDADDERESPVELP